MKSEGWLRQQAQLQVIRLISSLINSSLINRLSPGWDCRRTHTQKHNHTTTTTGKMNKTKLSLAFHVSCAWLVLT